MLSDAVILAIVAAIPPTLASVGALYVSLKNGQKVDENSRKVEEVHLATNSMKDQLVAATRSSALQEGHAAGLAEGKAP